MTDPLGRVTSYNYDALNRVITMTNPLEGKTTYGYDAAGNRTRVTDAELHSTIYGAYRSGIEQGYGGIEEYQRWSTPGDRGREIKEYLPFYRQKALRE